MKKFLVIAVLFSFLVNTMGYYVVFTCNRYLIQREMITQIRIGAFHPDLILLKILHPEKEPQFSRLEKNEFSYYGKLYDVVVQRQSGDTTLFYCLHDRKEETLLADYSLCLRRSGRSGSSNGNPILALLHNLVTQALIQNISGPSTDQGTCFLFPVLNSPVFPVYLVHFSPPPELA